MCGRYVRKDKEEVVIRFFEINDIRVNWTPNYNIPPTSKIPVVRQTPESRELVEMTWGLRPSWAKADAKLPMMHNARAETVAQRPSYRSAFKSRRCIVPASGYFEWKAGTPKQPFYFSRMDGRPLAFAAIWEHNEAAGDTVSIITTTPNSEAGKVHDRMPVILPEEKWERWFEESPLSEQEHGQLLIPAPDGNLSVWPVSRAVGNVRNNSPDLISAMKPG